MQPLREYSTLHGKELAKRFYVTGEELYYLASQKPLEFKQSLAIFVSATNLAFSAEISLKLLIQEESKKAKKVHDLLKLFKQLESKTQNRIINSTKIILSEKFRREYSEDEFFKDLEDSKDNFTNARYMFQQITKGPFSMKFAFLRHFSDNLLALVDEIKDDAEYIVDSVKRKDL